MDPNKPGYIDIAGFNALKNSKKGKWELVKERGSNAGTAQGTHGGVLKLKDGKTVYSIAADGKVLKVRSGK